MDNTTERPFDKDCSCNSAIIVAEHSGHDNPRLAATGWCNIKLIGIHGVYAIYTANRYGRKYFIKSLAEKYKNLQEWQRLLFKEFELGIQIDYPAIARTISWEELPEIGEAIVMEYVSGLELRDWLKSDKAHSKKERLNIVKQIADALKYIHSINISHRDLKPDNILVTHKGNNVKIIDFGLGDGDDFIVYKQAAGTEVYGAPEQMKGKENEATTGADIYSLGKIMQIMLPGLRYRRLIRRCLRTDATARPSAAEVVKSLNSPHHVKYVAAGLLLGTLLTAASLFYNRGTAKNNGDMIPQQSKTITDTLYIQKTDTIKIEIPGKPSESAIKAIWDKTLKDLEPQIEYYATFDSPNTEIEDVISTGGELLYYNLLGINCPEETAAAKRKELENYMRHRIRHYRSDTPTELPDTHTR